MNCGSRTCVLSILLCPSLCRVPARKPLPDRRRREGGTKERRRKRRRKEGNLLDSATYKAPWHLAFTYLVSQRRAARFLSQRLSLELSRLLSSGDSRPLHTLSTAKGASHLGHVQSGGKSHIPVSCDSAAPARPLFCEPRTPRARAHPRELHPVSAPCLSGPPSTVPSVSSPDKSLSQRLPGRLRITSLSSGFSRYFVGGMPGPCSKQPPEAQALSDIALNWPLSV